MTVRELTERLERYAGSPLISTKQICDMDGDRNRSRVIQKYGLDTIPRFGGTHGKYACMDVAQNMMERRVIR